MKIAQESPQQIVLKDDNFQGLLIGIIMTLVAIGVTLFTLSTHQLNNLVIFIVIFVFLAFGVVMILSSYFTTITLDKTTNKITFLRKGILGAKNSEYVLNTITRLELRERYQMSTNMNSSPIAIGTVSNSSNIAYQLFLIFNSGQEIPLDHMQTASTFSLANLPMLGGTSNERMIGQKLAAFLQVQFNDPGLPTLDGVIQNIVSSVKNNSAENTPPIQQT